MDREIKFRAQVVGTKEWVYGFYFQHDGVHSIFIPTQGSYTVIPETVGQFTGLKDKNGVEIYEGDKISGGVYGNFIVAWDDSHCGLTVNSYVNKKVIVIGNIHEKEATSE